MKAMILAAGEGTRLQPLTYSFPKPLVPIVNIPVMEHIVRWLSSSGIQEIVINTHYMAEQIENYFQDGTRLGVRIHYSREDRLWGTAGGVRRVADRFQETFLVIGGDDLTDIDLSRLMEKHFRKKALATIGLKEVDRTEPFGVAVTDDKGRILRFQEKPPTQEALSRLANTGIYLFEPEIFDFIPENEVIDFGRNVFPLLLEKKAPFYGGTVEGYWVDIGSLDQYKESHWAILDKKCKADTPGAEISPGIWVGEGVTIHPDAKIHPPCLLGSGTIVEKDAVLSGYVVTGGGARVKRGSALGRTILWKGSTAGGKLSDSVITPS